MPTIEQITAERDELRAQLTAQHVNASFHRSKYITDRLVIPPDIAEARFGGAFAVEAGRLVARDTFGNTIMSRSRMGEVADFDEAIEVLVANYPHRAAILKASGASGGGSQSSRHTGGRRTVTRAQFDSMAPLERVKIVREVQVVD